MSRAIDRLPAPVRRAFCSGATSISPAMWDRGFGLLGQRGGKLSGHRVHSVAELLRHRDGSELYHSMMSVWPNADSVVLGATPRPTVFDDPAVWTTVDHFHDRMMHLDQLDYLPEDLLVKVDRASMAASLESRAPFLDHRMVEFAGTVPLDMKTRDGKGKWLLRQALYDYVPASLIDRPKMGFAVPLAEWLRGPLRDWSEDLLSERRLREEGLLDPNPIRADWSEHLSGARDWKFKLWTVLMFQAWMAAERAQPRAVEENRETAVIGSGRESEEEAERGLYSPA
jgi:asparagine synthase (glutamine-hydrolysing)